MLHFCKEQGNFSTCLYKRPVGKVSSSQEEAGNEGGEDCEEKGGGLPCCPRQGKGGLRQPSLEGISVT